MNACTVWKQTSISAFDKLLKLHEASMVRPEAVVVKAPSAGVAEPRIAARSSEEARLPQSSEHVVQPGSEVKAPWPRKQQGSRRLPAVCYLRAVGRKVL